MAAEVHVSQMPSDAGLVPARKIRPHQQQTPILVATATRSRLSAFQHPPDSPGGGTRSQYRVPETVAPLPPSNWSGRFSSEPQVNDSAVLRPISSDSSRPTGIDDERRLLHRLRHPAFLRLFTDRSTVNGGILLAIALPCHQHGIEGLCDTAYRVP